MTSAFGQWLVLRRLRWRRRNGSAARSNNICDFGANAIVTRHFLRKSSGGRRFHQLRFRQWIGSTDEGWHPRKKAHAFWCRIIFVIVEPLFVVILRYVFDDRSLLGRLRTALRARCISFAGGNNSTVC